MLLGQAETVADCVFRRGRVSGGCVVRRGRDSAGCPDLAQSMAGIVWDEISWNVTEYYCLSACDAV